MLTRTMSAFNTRTQKQDIAVEAPGLDLEPFNPDAVPRAFISTITGGWIIRPENTLVQYVVDRFEGDATWFGRNWIADGTAVLRLITSDRKNIVRWSVDYHYESDTLAWVCGGETGTFDEVNNPASPIQCRVSEQNKKLLLIVKSDVQLGSYVLGRGSNLSVTGI